MDLWKSGGSTVLALLRFVRAMPGRRSLVVAPGYYRIYRLDRSA